VYLACVPENRWIHLLRPVLRMFSRGWLWGGIVAAVIGCGFAAYQSIWLFRSIPTRGIIVELTPIRDQEQNATSYAPRFTFKNDYGRAYTVTSSVQSNPPEFAVGEQVRVRYIRSNPSSAKLDSFWQLWLVPFVCTSLGIFFSGAGYLLLRLERRVF
jgi:hypothetical protein